MTIQMPDIPVRQYSIRRLCPFRSTLQVIETAHARALSPDGKNWELQVTAEQPDTLWGSVNTQNHPQQYFRFGIWSNEAGLAQVPINPIMDVGDMLENAEPLWEVLQKTAQQVPFPLVDNLEYWLLDTEAKPLALLATSTNNSVQQQDNDLPVWKAAQQPSSFGGNTHPPDQLQTPAITLESQIHLAAGAKRHTQWFKREANNGVGLDGRFNGNIMLSGRRLDHADFPELLIREQWPEKTQRSLAADYLAWSAPLLLTLQNISVSSRERLEKLAVKRPQLIEKYWRTYPEILNETLINKARVEARLKKSTV